MHAERLGIDKNLFDLGVVHAPIDEGHDGDQLARIAAQPRCPQNLGELSRGWRRSVVDAVPWGLQHMGRRALQRRLVGLARTTAPPRDIAHGGENGAPLISRHREKGHQSSIAHGLLRSTLPDGKTRWIPNAPGRRPSGSGRLACALPDMVPPRRRGGAARREGRIRAPRPDPSDSLGARFRR